jgi:hypothetical protein
LGCEFPLTLTTMVLELRADRVLVLARSSGRRLLHKLLHGQLSDGRAGEFFGVALRGLAHDEFGLEQNSLRRNGFAGFDKLQR